MVGESAAISTAEPINGFTFPPVSLYIIRPPLSQKRMTYIPEYKSPDGTIKVVYEGKTTRTNETFTALDSGWSQASLLLAYAS